VSESYSWSDDSLSGGVEKLKQYVLAGFEERQRVMEAPWQPEYAADEVLGCGISARALAARRGRDHAGPRVVIKVFDKGTLLTETDETAAARRDTSASPSKKVLSGLKLVDREAVGANAALAALNAAKTASGSAAPEDPIVGNSWAIVPCVIAVEATYVVFQELGYRINAERFFWHHAVQVVIAAEVLLRTAYCCCCLVRTCVCDRCVAGTELAAGDPHRRACPPRHSAGQPALPPEGRGPH
jgi:hypothetical protein